MNTCGVVQAAEIFLFSLPWRGYKKCATADRIQVHQRGIARAADDERGVLYR